jgi:hypothetical protein
MIFIPILRGTSAGAKLIYKFFVYDTSVTTAAGLSGKAYSDFTVKYIRQGEALSGAITPENITTIGTYAAPTANTNCRIKEISASAPCVGYYELQIHADWVATTNTPADLTIFITVTGGKVAPIEIPLTTFDLQAAIAQTTNGFLQGILGTALTETSAGYLAAALKKLLDVATPVFTAASVNQTGDAYARIGAPAGASASADIAAIKSDSGAIKTKTDYLPSATAGAAGGLFIAGSNAATTVNITGTITTVTNLTNAATNGDLTSTMKTSVTTAATAATPTINTLGANAITAASIAADAGTEIAAAVATALGTGAGLTTLATAAELAKVPKSDGSASFNATALAAINAEVDTALNTAIPGSPTANSINDRLDAKISSISAGSGLDAAGVRAAIGMTSANMDTQLADIPTVAEMNARTIVSANYALDSTVAKAAELAKVPKSDSNVTFNETALASINAEVDAALNTAIPGSPTAGSINERIDAKISSISGGSGLDAAGVRAAVGLTSANLDAQLADIPTVAEMNARTIVAANYALDSTVAKADELAKVPKSDGSTTWNNTALGSINTQCDTALADAGVTTTVTGRIDASITSRGIALDAAGVRSAVGLASANLDTQIADVPTVTEMNARTIVAANYALDATVAKSAELDKVPKSDSNVSWNATAQAAIKTQAGLALSTGTISELSTGLPPVTPTYAEAIMLPYMALRNETTETAESGKVVIKNDAGTTICHAVVSDADAVLTKGKLVSGA